MPWTYHNGKKPSFYLPFFPGIQGTVYWQLSQKRDSCTPLKSKCLVLQQVIPFKWGPHTFPDRTQWHSTWRPALSTGNLWFSCRTRSFPATDRSPQTCWQHLLSSTWDYSQPPMSCLSDTPSFTGKAPWPGLSKAQLSHCNKFWNRETSEIKGLTYELLFYIAFSLLFC